MLFAKGSRVRLKHSSDCGVVTDILDKDLLMVRLDGNEMEIPVFTEDLERAIEAKTGGTKGKIIVTNSPEGQQEERNAPPVESQYAILKSFGIQLAFDPQAPSAFRLFLLNDTNQEYVYHFLFLSAGKPKYETHGKLPAVSAVPLGSMQMDDLNEQPEVHVKCSKITTDGLSPELTKELKIKAKKFFSKTITAPILNRPVHLYRLFDRNEQAPQPSEKEDLKTYTLRKAGPAGRTSAFKRNPSHEVVELAHFVPEIDLHIEKLLKNPKKMTNAEITRIQLSHFETFMDKALRVGAERVFIIHGVGKGKLRDAIATRLMQMEYVKTFENKFHPRYGFGATEVVLR